MLEQSERSQWAKRILSYDDNPVIARLYRRRGIRIERLAVTYYLGSKSGKGDRKKELLIRNF